MCTYLIQLRGQVDILELNMMSPHQMTVIQADPAVTLISICTDQSGMVGLLRHLHSLGFVFLSIVVQPLVENPPAVSGSVFERKE